LGGAFALTYQLPTTALTQAQVTDEEGNLLALKLHRLGRTSFRNVRTKRDYLRSTTASYNWLHLSKLSALKEFAFMKALGEHGFPVPRAVELNRHAVLMSLVPATPLTQIRELANPDAVWRQVAAIMNRLAQHGAGASGPPPPAVG
jgi:RIO kinase 2